MTLDRARIRLIALGAVATAVVAVGTCLSTRSGMFLHVQLSGWASWALLATAAGLAVKTRLLARSYPNGLVIALLATLLIQICQPHGWKNAAAEMSVALEAQDLVADHTAAATTERWYDPSGQKQIVKNIDLEPSGWPAFQAVVGMATGVRESTAFIANALATFLVLFFAWSFGRRAAGGWGGLFSLLILPALPLFATVATGAGREPAFLAAFLFAGVTLWDFAEEPTGTGLALATTAVVLLVQMRSDGFWPGLPCAGCALAVAWRRRLSPSGWTFAIPLALLPSVAVISRAPALWAHGARPTIGAWGASVLQSLFDWQTVLPNSPVLAWMLAVMAVLGLWRLRVDGSKPALWVIPAMAAAAAATAFASWVHRFPLWSEAAGARYSLPVYIGLGALALPAYGWLVRDRRVWAAGLTSALVWGVCYLARPTHDRYRFVTPEQRLVNAFDWATPTQADENWLWISETPAILRLHGFDAITPARANMLAPQLAYDLHARFYSRVVMVDTLSRAAPSGAWAPDSGRELPASFRVLSSNTVPVTPGLALRIRRVEPVAPGALQDSRSSK